MTFSIEFKPEDCWIGVFWRRGRDLEEGFGKHFWICLIPCFPIHFRIPLKKWIK